MLTDIGPSLAGGDMDASLADRAKKLIVHFEKEILEVVTEQNIARRHIRPILPGSIICGHANGSFYVAFFNHLGMPSVSMVQLVVTGNPSLLSFHKFVIDMIGVDFCAVELLSSWLDRSDLRTIIRAVAIQVISREMTRKTNEATIMSNNSVFGPNHYPVQDNLVFTLMPFEAQLTEVYNQFVKPSIEKKGLVCRRADDIASNNAIMHDIWKSICEARFIVADISTLNPNVMYELGIAHTLGKETLLINQEGSSPKFPFDIAHMRILTYKNTAIGGADFSTKLEQAIDSIMAKITSSSLIADSTLS